MPQAVTQCLSRLARRESLCAVLWDDCLVLDWETEEPWAAHKKVLGLNPACVSGQPCKLEQASLLL